MRTSGDHALLHELSDDTDSGESSAQGTLHSNGPTRPQARVEGATPTLVRLLRSARTVMHLLGGLSTTVFVFPWIGPAAKQKLIARWCRQLLAMLEVEPRVHWRHESGMPGNVLIVANHISWLDIFVLCSFQPARFIAKADLRRLPVVGRLIANVGTLFIERERRRDTHTVNRHTVEALARGDIVAVFPEATTSDGTGLLKFHSSLLQSAVDAKAHVQPIAIRYRTPGDELCLAPAYVGELSLVGSFWRVTGERRTIAELHVLPWFPAGTAHRRELSRAAEDAIRMALALPARVPEPGTRAGRPA